MTVRTRHSISNKVPDDLPTQRHRQVLDVWRAAKRYTDLPPVDSISPLSIPKDLLAGIAIVSVEDGHKRLKVRLVGERIKIATATNPTHQWGDDLKGGEDVFRAYMACAQQRLPLYCEGPTSWSINSFMSYRALLTPFAGDDGSVRRILTYLEID